MTAIFEREFKSFFNSVIGYVIIAFILAFIGIYTLAFNLDAGYSNFEYVLQSMTFVFMIVIPILTMRSIADERRQKTDQLLYSLPISMAKVVMGKYLAMLAVLAIPTLIICFYPLILTAFGTVYLPTAYSAIFGFFFMGAALVAIGLFISSMTENQAIAAVVCFVVMLINYFMTSLSGYLPDTAIASFLGFTILVILIAVVVYFFTKNGIAAALAAIAGEIILGAITLFASETMAGLFPTFLSKISVFDRFFTFAGGMFDLTALTFFVAAIFIFLFLSVQSLEKRRWS